MGTCWNTHTILSYRYTNVLLAYYQFENHAGGWLWRFLGHQLTKSSTNRVLFTMYVWFLYCCHYSLLLVLFAASVRRECVCTDAVHLTGRWNFLNMLNMLPRGSLTLQLSSSSRLSTSFFL